MALKLSEKFLWALESVNNDIAWDMPSDTTEAEMAEACLDAGRFRMAGYDEAADELTALCAEHGWSAVVAEASAHVSLV